MRKTLKVLFGTVKWSFIVLCVYLGSLFFRSERIPGGWVQPLVDRHVPKNLCVRFDSVAFGFRSGLILRGLRVTDRNERDPFGALATASLLRWNWLADRIEADDLTVPRLPKSYYEPGNVEKNDPVEFVFPELPQLSLELVRPNILGVTPARLVADVETSARLLSVSRIHLDWPEQDEVMFLDGSCDVDLLHQEVRGEVRGTARQSHIRPLLVALDVPVALPYMDAFTEVPERVPSYCGWHVNLRNNDFDLDLDLRPKMGRYNSVPMQKVHGKIHLHVYTRENCLNYRQTFGPIIGVGAKGEPLDGTVWVSGSNGYNRVTVKAESALPVAHLLRIGGFTGDYVSDDVVGASKCDLEFGFPRAMTNNYEVMDGRGHLEIRHGQVMRLKGFSGLLKLLAEKVPGFSILTDSTQAAGDYVIEKGVLKTDNIYIEGTVFSMKMYGTFDMTTGGLDFTVRVQFAKKDSMAGKILQPLTWPFTKLLLEFRLRGTTEAPKWDYLSVLDRVLEVVK